MKPVLILFDVDGTLVDTAGAGRRALVEAFCMLAPREGVLEAARRVRFQGKTDPAIIREIAGHLGLDAEALERRLPNLTEAYLEALRAQMRRPGPRRRVLPGVRELLERLAREAWPRLGLVTGNLEAGARLKLEPFALNPCFPVGGFGSDAEDRAEVARIGYHRGLRYYGAHVPPERTIIVGDTAMDVACARANGFRVVAVDSGWAEPGELERSRPDALLPSFEPVERAVAVLEEAVP